MGDFTKILYKLHFELINDVIGAPYDKQKTLISTNGEKIESLLIHLCINNKLISFLRLPFRCFYFHLF